MIITRINHIQTIMIYNNKSPIIGSLRSLLSNGNKINKIKTSERICLKSFRRFFIFPKISHRTKSVPYREKMHYSHNLNHQSRYHK